MTRFSSAPFYAGVAPPIGETTAALLCLLLLGRNGPFVAARPAPPWQDNRLAVNIGFRYNGADCFAERTRNRKPEPNGMLGQAFRLTFEEMFR
jgi:hypothetical protein